MITISHGNAIRIATLSHGKANAFDLELSAAIARTIDDFRASADAALLFTGQGTMFSAGVDLVRLVEEGAPYVQRFLPALNGAFEAVFSCPKPVVCAINGHAIAGGCILALAADYRVMARGAGRIGVPELRVGVPFPPVPLEILRFAAARHLPSLVYGGATFSAEEAASQGIVDEVVESDRLIDAAVAAAERLAALPPAVFALTKRQVREPAMHRIRDGAATDGEVTAMWMAPDTIAGIRDYIARTFKKS